MIGRSLGDCEIFVRQLWTGGFGTGISHAHSITVAAIIVFHLPVLSGGYGHIGSGDHVIFQSGGSLGVNHH